MDDPIVLEMLEGARWQPLRQPETQRSPRIKPELLIAIVNGDLISFKKFCETQEAPTNNRDVESVQVAGHGTSGLSGVACGGNTALHVVAGVIEKLSLMETFSKPLNLNLQPSSYRELAEASAVILIYSVQSFTISLLHTISFVFAVKKHSKSMAAVIVNVDKETTAVGFITTTVVRLSLLGETKLADLWKSCTVKWKQCELQMVKKVETTRWLKWLLYLPSCRNIYRRRMYLKIAETIYREDKALLIAQNDAMETPLHCAAKAGKLEMVCLLISFAREEGTEKLKEVLRAKNHVGETALHEAARSGYSEIVKELLDADEEVVVDSGAEGNLANLTDNSEVSPLYLAVVGGYIDVVNKLIASEGPISYGGPDKQMALHAAVLKDEEEITHIIHGWKKFLARETDKEDNTPLHYAALIGNWYAVRVLLSEDKELVYKKNLSGLFPVHIAAEAGNSRVIKEMLSSCPDVGELLDGENRNFLHVAIEKKRTEVIMLVCHATGLTVNLMNAKDKDGNTPLHLAVKSSDSGIFALLSQNSAVNPNIRNNDGLTPLDISTSLQDHQFTYSLSPQSIIHRALLTRDAFQNPCQPDLSRKADNLMNNGARADCPDKEKGKEASNSKAIDPEKESTKYENMSKSLITGAVLIASAAFGAVFTVSGVYKGENSSHTWINRNNVFKAFIIANVLAFICAIVSTTWLLYSALTNFHLKYRKFYFERCIPILYGAINLFILTFGLGGYIAIAPCCEWLGIFIFVVSGIAIINNIIWNPQFVPLILLAPYIRVEPDS